jgi:SAM-dependent methyltransferase
MKQTLPWYEDDRFWLDFAPYMFNSERWANAEEEAKKLVTLLDLSRGDSVLDHCCGVGRHALGLARQGLEVTGVDRTEQFLRAAEETARANSCPITFVQDDVRKFCRPEAYDAVINMFTSFGYFEQPEDEQKTLSNVYHSLKSGGRFLIELMGKEILARIFVPREWYQEEDTLVLMEREVLGSWDQLKNRWILIRDNEKIEYEFSHKLYSAVELQSLLTSAGFEEIETYGSLDGSPYDHTSNRLIMIGHKS